MLAGLPLHAKRGSLVETAAEATNQKPTQPRRSKLSVLRSKGPNEAIGASQVALCLGTHMHGRLASGVELSARRRAVRLLAQMLAAERKQGRFVLLFATGRAGVPPVSRTPEGFRRKALARR